MFLFIVEFEILFIGNVFLLCDKLFMIFVISVMLGGKEGLFLFVFEFGVFNFEWFEFVLRWICVFCWWIEFGMVDGVGIGGVF